MNSKTTLWGREPVLILSLIEAAIALVSAFFTPLDPAQIGVLMAFAAAVIGVLARQQVTPVAKLPNGQGGTTTEAA